MATRTSTAITKLITASTAILHTRFRRSRVCASLMVTTALCPRRVSFMTIISFTTIALAAMLSQAWFIMALTGFGFNDTHCAYHNEGNENSAELDFHSQFGWRKQFS